MDAAFPSLVVTAAGLAAQGSFATSQAEYLDPDPESVTQLRELLGQKKAGIVAHFYMDAELQGILYALDWPHVHVSDSLKMADAALEMVADGAEVIVVLGVDFMSENVRALLDASGHDEVPVLRVARQSIGCSLAESAESRNYQAYLRRASESERPLHVVYINTSLRTKARAQHQLPTITCTSSNVVKTVLSAAAQDPEVDIWFGPDTYMGQNLAALLRHLSNMDEAAIGRLHPAHTPATIAALADRFHYYEQGSCIVHHMFGQKVAETVRAEYPDAYVTAHLEVPGEMFELALAAQMQGRGVVGSTADILGFIGDRAREAIDAGQARRLSFVLGTEAGMVTSIVRDLRSCLGEHPESGVEVEIIFPVAQEAVAATGDQSLPLVPGVAGGEGCSVEGGCATCPFMKLNSYDALIDVLKQVGETDVSDYWPNKYAETIGGNTVAELGGQPILHMRDFQRDGALGARLLEHIARHASAHADA